MLVTIFNLKLQGRRQWRSRGASQNHHHFLEQKYTKQLLNINKHEVYLIGNQKQRGTHVKVIKTTLLNIVNIVTNNLQVQLQQFANLFKGKPYCSTDTLLEVLSTFFQTIPENIVTKCSETSNNFPIYLATNTYTDVSNASFSAMNNKNRLGSHWLQSDAITHIPHILSI